MRAWAQFRNVPRAAENARSISASPGYYTLHVLRDGKVTGMLSLGDLMRSAGFEPATRRRIATGSG